MSKCIATSILTVCLLASPVFVSAQPTSVTTSRSVVIQQLITLYTELIQLLEQEIAQLTASNQTPTHVCNPPQQPACTNGISVPGGTDANGCQLPAICEQSSTTPSTAQLCTWNGQTITSGQSVTAYQSSAAPFGSRCVSEQRTCTRGTLSGSYTNASCTVGTAASCAFNGQTIQSGSSVTAYQSASVAYGQTCTSQQRTCTNGILFGSYQYLSCSVGQPASCSFNGQSVANGASITAFQSASVAYGATCTSQQRTCTNGTLSGSYQNSACTVQSPASCTTPWGNLTVQTGQEVMDEPYFSNGQCVYPGVAHPWSAENNSARHVCQSGQWVVQGTCHDPGATCMGTWNDCSSVGSAP